MSDKEQIEQETLQILAMFGAIQRSYKALPHHDRIKVSAALEDTERFGFEGFDANHDPHIFVARDLAQAGKLDAFGDVKEWTELNSHSSGSISIYRRMLEAFTQFSTEILTAEQIIKVVWSPLQRSSERNRH